MSPRKDEVQGKWRIEFREEAICFSAPRVSRNHPRPLAVDGFGGGKGGREEGRGMDRMDKASQSNVVIKLWSYYNRTPYVSSPSSLTRENVVARLIAAAASTLPYPATFALSHTMWAVVAFLVLPSSLSLFPSPLWRRRRLLSVRCRRGGVSRLVRLIAIKDLVTGRGTALRKS